MILETLVGIGLNTILGATIMSLIDKDDVLFSWYKSAPNDVMKFLLLNAWPVPAVAYLRAKYLNRKPR